MQKCLFSYALCFFVAIVGITEAADSLVVFESAREIPVAYQADVVVVGGTTYGVDAATSAAKAGAKVFLIASQTYLGEDKAATLQLWGANGAFTTPLKLKATLDAALVDSKVEFLLSSFATDVLRDDDGKLCGVVMANRAGRQAVLAKTIIDATPEALVARLAGITVPSITGEVSAEWSVIGGAAKSGAKTRRLQQSVCHVYSLKLPITDGSWAARAKAEQIARDWTYDPGQKYTSKVPLFMTKAFSATAPRLWVIAANGTQAGMDAAVEAKKTADPKGVTVDRAPNETALRNGEVKELLGGIRLAAIPQQIRQPAGALPVLGQYDVVVVGGGTSGACAGIGAARHGAKTLVIEYLHGLGGVGTEGMIGSYWFGNRVGFTKDIPESPIEIRKEWYRHELLIAGADIWFGTLGCGAYVEKNIVKGVVVATPFGRGVVLAKTVIDSTGSSDTAIAAGAGYTFVDGNDVAVQGTGLPLHALGKNRTNTDFTFADDSDPLNIRSIFVSTRAQKSSNFDVSQGSVRAQPPSGRYFDVSQLIDTRERRRIVGDFVLDPLDIENNRTYPDSIVLCNSGIFDTHGYTIHPYSTLVPLKTTKTFIPYRCLLPKGLDGILVTGLGISAHRDAMPVIRMQPDMQNQGYAAGYAAAMAAKAGTSLRAIDMKALQKHLVEIGNLSNTVLTDQDSYPPSIERISRAVSSMAKEYRGAEVVFWNPVAAMPLLRSAFEKATGPAKLIYAHTLGILGDATGAGLLCETVAKTDWDKGWNFRGSGQFGGSRSTLDSLIQALGLTKDTQALPILNLKASQLTTTSEFSHCRAIAVALEQFADPSSASVLADVLKKLTGNREDRDFALREITLARALFRCGDHEGLARKILEEYTLDPRGPFALHAIAVLASKGHEKAK